MLSRFRINLFDSRSSLRSYRSWSIFSLFLWFWCSFLRRLFTFLDDFGGFFNFMLFLLNNNLLFEKFLVIFNHFLGNFYLICTCSLNNLIFIFFKLLILLLNLLFMNNVLFLKVLDLYLSFLDLNFSFFLCNV